MWRESPVGAIFSFRDHDAIARKKPGLGALQFLCKMSMRGQQCRGLRRLDVDCESMLDRAAACSPNASRVFFNSTAKKKKKPTRRLKSECGRKRLLYLRLRESTSFPSALRIRAESTTTYRCVVQCYD